MDTTKERAQLIAEIARELYDRFVMGGWEPQDAYAQIDEWLRRAEHSTETPPPSVAAQTRAMKVAVDYGERVASQKQSTETPPLEEIRGAVARGWCHYPNTAKEFDGDLAEAISKEIVKLLAEAPSPVGTPEKCPECDSTDRRMHGLISHGALVPCDDPWHRGPVGTPVICGNCGLPLEPGETEEECRKMNGPLGTPDSAIESADELAKAAFALGKLAGERGKKP